jgi:hypothetical protein
MAARPSEKNLADRLTDRPFLGDSRGFFYTYFPSLLTFAEAAKPKADLKKQVDSTKSLSQPVERAFQTSIEKVEERNTVVLFTFFAVRDCCKH